MFKIKFKIIVFLFAILIFKSGFSLTLSDSSFISILTCSPGSELYSVFGHTAIRVNDPVLGIDIVFNYGTFDFNTPNFYAKFVKGKLNYKLSLSKYEYFIFEYEAEERSVFEQKLNFNKTEKQKLYELLVENYKPENRYYLYDFFYDNCSSRIRDIVENATVAKLNYNYLPKKENANYRNLLYPYIHPKSWLDLGINLALGLRADKNISVRDYMFLPDYILSIYDSSTINDGIIESRLTQPIEVKFLAVEKPVEEWFILKAPVILWILFLITVLFTIFAFLKNKNFRFIDYFLFSVTGLLGVLLTFLWFFTDHKPMEYNLNTLWAFPLNLMMLFYLHKPGVKFFQVYMLFTLLLNTIILLSWPVFPQHYHYAVFPLVLSIFIRVGMYVHKGKLYKNLFS
ncbi:MAG: DUF4105 domain-containing protein [Bacteroidota bacterium]